MAKFFSDLELEDNLDSVAEAIASRDIREWPDWFVFLIKQCNKKTEYRVEWLRSLLEKIEREFSVTSG